MKKLLSMLGITVLVANPVLLSTSFIDNSIRDTQRQIQTVKKIVEEKIDEINSTILNKDYDKGIFLLKESKTFGFEIYDEYSFSLYQNKIYELISFLKDFKPENKEEISLYQYDFEVMTKEWRDFPDNNLQSAKKIVMNSIENYKLNVRQLYYAKNMYYSEAIEKDIETYGQAKLDLVEVRNEILVTEQKININREIVADTDTYYNWHNELEYAYKKWIGEFYVYFDSINLLFLGDDGSLSSDNFMKKIEEIQYEVIDELIKYYFPDEDSEEVLNRLTGEIKEEDLNISVDFQPPEWMQNKSGLDLSPSALYDQIREYIDKQLLEIENHGIIPIKEFMEALVEETITGLASFFGSEIKKLIEKTDEFHFWATATATAVLPELTEVFEKHGLPINVQQQQALKNGQFLFEVLSDLAFQIGSTFVSLFEEPLLFVSIIALKEISQIGVSAILAANNMNKMFGVINEFEEVLNNALAIPEDIEERKDEAVKKLNFIVRN